MFILDSLLVGSLRFVLDKVAAAVDSELTDESHWREQLLEAQMKCELGEITEAELAETERDVLARLREIREAREGPNAGQPLKVTGVEASISGELHESE